MRYNSRPFRKQPLIWFALAVERDIYYLHTTLWCPCVQIVGIDGGSVLMVIPSEVRVPRKERERRFISEYMLQAWPEGGYQLNVELGPIPQEYVDRLGLGKAAALFRPTRPRVDAE